MSETRSPVQTPGRDVVRRVRAAFVMAGTSLKAWCQANHVDYGWAWRSLSGKAKGPAARAMTERIKQAAGVL